MKPCPFCKSTKVQPALDHGPTSFGSCLDCGARGPEKFCSLYADEAWNTRPIEDQLQARITELEAFVRGCEDNWDCDTGANWSHHSHCRACDAKRLLPKEETK